MFTNRGWYALDTTNKDTLERLVRPMWFLNYMVRYSKHPIPLNYDILPFHKQSYHWLIHLYYPIRELAEMRGLILLSN